MWICPLLRCGWIWRCSRVAVKTETKVNIQSELRSVWMPLTGMLRYSQRRLSVSPHAIRQSVGPQTGRECACNADPQIVTWLDISECVPRIDVNPSPLRADRIRNRSRPRNRIPRSCGCSEPTPRNLRHLKTLLTSACQALLRRKIHHLHCLHW
jgi:hypothetical protein